MSVPPESPGYINSPSYGQIDEGRINAIDNAYDEDGLPGTRANHVSAAGSVKAPHQPASSVNTGDDEALFVSDEPPKPLTMQSLSGLAPARRRPPTTRPPAHRSAVQKSRRVVKIRGEEFRTAEMWNRAKTNSTQVHGGFYRLLGNILRNVEAFSRSPSLSLIKSLRQDIASAPLHRNVNQVAISDSGFMTILDRMQGKDLPAEFVDDILSFWKRWNAGNFDHSIMRGLKLEKSDNEATQTSRLVWSLDATYQYKREGNKVGSNDLQNGQWWPYQLAALQDGAVGTSQGGITVNSEYGAVAIVITSSKYEDDVDQGNELWYSGTYAKTDAIQEITKATKAMDTARDRRTPVRVVRSAGGKKNADNYLPSHGFRYDGLYNITDREEVDKAKGRYRFKLERRFGQPPIRYKGADARPNSKEIEALTELNEMKTIKK